LLGFSVGIAFFPPAKAPRSAVIFSWSMSFADGICANDFRDLGRVAGRVTSSREDMIARALEAQICFCGEFQSIVHEVVGLSRDPWKVLSVAGLRHVNKNTRRVGLG
jgi:hypothetical protein